MRKILIALFLWVGILAQAHAIIVSLSARLTDVGQNYFGGGVVDYFHVGDVVNFSFTYDPTAANPDVDPNGNKYVVSQFTLSTSGYVATVLNRGALKFSDSPTYDSFFMTSGYSGLMESYGVPLSGVPLLNGDFLADVGLLLMSSKGAFTSASLDQPLRLSDFDSALFYFSFREPVTTFAMGTMQSYQILSLTSDANALPEPSAITLLSVGLFAAAAAGRKRKG